MHIGKYRNYEIIKVSISSGAYILIVVITSHLERENYKVLKFFMTKFYYFEISNSL